MPFVQRMHPGELARPVLRKKPYPEDVPPVAAPGPVLQMQPVPQVQPVLQVQPEASLQPPEPMVPEVKPLIYGSQASRLLTAPQAPAAPAAQLPLREAGTFYGLPLGPAPEAVASAPAERSPSQPPPFQMNVDPPRPLPSEPEDAMEQQRAAHEGEMKRLEGDPVTARFAQQLRGLEADEKVMRENIRATLPEAEQEEMVKKLETELLFERLRVGKAMNQAVNAEAESLRTAAGIAHRKGQQAYEERMEAHEKSWAEQQNPLLGWANTVGDALQLPGPLNPGWWAQKVTDDFGPYDHQRKRVQQQVRSEEEAEVLRREAVKKTGLDPDNPEHARLLEDAKQMDWTAGGQQVGESAISGTGMAGAESFKNAMIQSLTEGKWEVNRAENSRLLKDGSVVVNPLLIHDDAAYAKAVQEAQATPEAKRQAMDRLRDLQRGQAKALLPSLKSTPDFFPGEQFTDYVGRRAQEEPAFGVLPEAEQARLFLREQVQRGYGTRLADKLGTSLLLGTGDFFTQVNGGLAIATGGLPGVGEYFSQNAADLAMLGAMVDESTEARTGTGALGRVTGGVVRMLPPLVAQALITRGLRVNMLPEKAAKAVIYGLAGAQTAGGQYAALYGQLRQQGAGPMEAWLSASGPAMASGLATAGLTALGGATGTEALLLPGARGRVAQGVRGFWKEALKNVPAHAMKEVPEEFFDEMASTVIEAMALGKDPKEALGGFLAESPEFIGSVMLLGGSGGLHSSRQQTQAAAPVPLLPAQGGDRPVPIPPVAGAGGATGSAAEIQRPEASVPANPPLPTRAPAPAPSGLPLAVGNEVGGPAPQTSPDPMPPGQPPQAVSNHPEMAQATPPTSHREAPPAPPIWQGRARHGEDAAVLGRNPDGTFQVRLNGAEKTFKESQVAAMTGLQRGPLYAHLAQATRQQLALPHPPSLPPIWQGRARHGEDAAVLGRNPDGTFQVRLNGTEKTFKESQVAAMTGMQRGPLYEMLERATVGRIGGSVVFEAPPVRRGDVGPNDTSLESLAPTREVLLDSLTKNEPSFSSYPSANIKLPQTISDLQSMLKPMQAEARQLMNEANRLELELKTLDFEISKSGISSSKKIQILISKKQLVNNLSSTINKRLALAEATRMLVAIPPDKRGHVRWRQRLVLDLGKQAAAAGDLTAQYVDARFLPSLTVGLVSSNKPRATYDATERSIKLDPDKASLSDAMHEITHGIEHQNPIILRKTIAFLNQRAKGSNSEQMSVMMDGFDNNPEARGYRDKWWARGGDHYSGRYYTDKAGKIIATEILTTGLQRLHRSPIEFFTSDPEFFTFVVTTLRFP